MGGNKKFVFLVEQATHGLVGRSVSRLLCLLCAAAVGISSVYADDSEVQEQLRQVQRELRALDAKVERIRSALEHLISDSESLSRSNITSGVTIDGERLLGNRDAAIGIVEFSDYQCPYCRRFHRETFEALRHKYIDTRKVLYIYRDFPLVDIHPEARAAAIAANCAGEQGAYWSMRRRLLENQSALSPTYYMYLAKHLQLDVETFRTCLEDPEQATRVEGDLKEGMRLGVRGTPYFLIGRWKNGVLTDVKTITGAQPFSLFVEVIEALLN